jgi:hypothetical protein
MLRTLWPGAFIHVHLTIAVRKNVLTVPLTYASGQHPRQAR